VFYSLDVLEDGRDCRPCPEHGICENGGLDCEEGYRRIDRRCTEDQEVSLYADHLASLAATILRDRAGRVECGESVKHVLTHADLRDLLEPKREASSSSGNDQGTISRRRSQRFDTAKFSPAFSRAVLLLEAGSAFGVSHNYGGFKALKPHLPFRCVARRFALRNWRFFTAAIVTAIMYVYVSLRRQRAIAKKLAILDACDSARAALEEQAIIAHEGTTPYDYVTDTHLRDEVVGNSRAAIQLWKEVEVELRRDTRVSLSGQETHMGHPCYKWRWCGRQSLLGSNSRRSSFASTPGASSAGRRSIGRSSLGSTPGSAPMRASGQAWQSSPAAGPSPVSAGVGAPTPKWTPGHERR
jgi:Man1-Src1p-C-terminal domain